MDAVVEGGSAGGQGHEALAMAGLAELTVGVLRAVFPQFMDSAPSRCDISWACLNGPSAWELDRSRSMKLLSSRASLHCP